MEKKSSEIVKELRIELGKWNSTKMENYNINGAIVKTNYGSAGYPYWDGNGVGYNRVTERQTIEEVFNKLIAEGYNYIRFVETTTRVRGYHEVYYSCKIKNKKNLGRINKDGDNSLL